MKNEYKKAYITVRGKKDDAGRQLFTIQRKSNQLGYHRNLSGYFGQGFFANLEEHLKRIGQTGTEIIFIEKELENNHIDTKTGLLKA